MISVSDLISYIEQHGNKARARGGVLVVTSVWSRDGIGYDVEEVIPATFHAVRVWLGY